MAHVKLRASECVLIVFFAYVTAISPWFRDRMNLKAQPVFVLAAVTATLVLLAVAESGKLSNIVGIIRDWLPLALTLAAFREMELFLPRHFDYHYESIWIRWDHLFLHSWHAQALIESLGKLVPFYLEFCYLLVYGIGAYCLAVLYAETGRKTADAFLTIYLVGTLAAYALFPYFPSQPPRYVFPTVDPPHVSTWVRRLNLFI